MKESAASEITGHTSGMIALIPSIYSSGVLEVDGGDEADQLHCSIAYLGEAADISDEVKASTLARVKELANIMAPFDGRAFAHAIFNPDGGPEGDSDPASVYLIGNAPQIETCYLEFKDLSTNERYVPFFAHVTAGFNLPLEKLDYTGTVTFDRIRVAFGNDVTDVYLAGDIMNEKQASTKTAWHAGKDNEGYEVLTHIEFPFIATVVLNDNDPDSGGPNYLWALMDSDTFDLVADGVCDSIDEAQAQADAALHGFLNNSFTSSVVEAGAYWSDGTYDIELFPDEYSDDWTWAVYEGSIALESVIEGEAGSESAAFIAAKAAVDSLKGNGPVYNDPDQLGLFGKPRKKRSASKTADRMTNQNLIDNAVKMHGKNSPKVKKLQEKFEGKEEEVAKGYENVPYNGPSEKKDEPKEDTPSTSDERKRDPDGKFAAVKTGWILNDDLQAFTIEGNKEDFDCTCGTRIALKDSVTPCPSCKESWFSWSVNSNKHFARTVMKRDGVILANTKEMTYTNKDDEEFANGYKWAGKSLSLPKTFSQEFRLGFIAALEHKRAELTNS